MGSVLAPTAKISANVNVDGNIVGHDVTISGGESHRWDLVTTSGDYNGNSHPPYPWEFIDEPDVPDDSGKHDETPHKEDESPKDNEPSKNNDYHSEDQPSKDDNSYIEDQSHKDDESHNENQPQNHSEENHSDSDLISNSSSTPAIHDEQSNEFVSQSSTEFYLPLAKHGQDLDDSKASSKHINKQVKVVKKGSASKSTNNQLYSDCLIKDETYYNQSSFNSSYSESNTKSNNFNSIVKEKMDSSVAKQLPATSEKPTNVLSWIGFVTVSSLSIFKAKINKKD